ncbi:carbon-nitrogen hydrolase [Sordaria brevicollis]|uniref:Carbon-nitrogen hydrolase n=1 Tax=Sordaria brevicollis TaxID=83679 RepID=A0AAE0P336_SORBR|nr:carbon-nitrogen hydrolase [Sordaria brevicollis]
MAPSKIRIATASPATQPTTPETIAQIAHLAHRAASHNIDILLLPEAYLGGYPRGTNFGCVMGSRSAEGRDEYLRYFQAAVDLGDIVGEGGAGGLERWVRRELVGDDVYGEAGGKSGGEGGKVKNKRGDGTREELEKIARETGVFLVTGCIEKAGGSLYCSVVYVCPKMGMIGKRRKVMPTAIERLVWAQGSPATLRAVSTVIRGVRINLAAAICWENYMPMLRQSLYSQNINLYLAPTADGRDTWLPLMRTVAIEGRCFVVSSNMCVRKDGKKQQPKINGRPVLSQQQQQTDDSAIADPSPFDRGGRRSSVVTEEGFEIALPSPRSGSRGHPKKVRRQSIFDEDGNEIVLPCCDEQGNAEPEVEAEIDDETVSTTTAKTSQSVAPSAPTQAPKVDSGKTSKYCPVIDRSTGKADEFVSRGGSAIVSPFGDVLAGPQWEDDDGIIWADVDFEDCIRGRLDLDTAGSYSRNDSFKLTVEGLDMSPLPYH